MSAYYITLLSISVTDVQCENSLDSYMKRGLLSTDMHKYWFNYVRTFLQRNIRLIFECSKIEKKIDFHFILLSIEKTQFFKQFATNITQFNQNCSKRWEKMEKGIMKSTAVNVNYIMLCRQKL